MCTISSFTERKGSRWIDLLMALKPTFMLHQVYGKSTAYVCMRARPFLVVLRH